VTVGVCLFDILGTKSIEAVVEKVVGMIPAVRVAEPHEQTLVGKSILHPSLLPATRQIMVLKYFRTMRGKHQMVLKTPSSPTRFNSLHIKCACGPRTTAKDFIRQTSNLVPHGEKESCIMHLNMGSCFPLRERVVQQRPSAVEAFSGS
jgi:hypothetical protein